MARNQFALEQQGARNLRPIVTAQDGIGIGVNARRLCLETGNITPLGLYSRTSLADRPTGRPTRVNEVATRDCGEDSWFRLRKLDDNAI